MDKIKLVLLAFGLSLLLGACADMMGPDETMEPAAGPAMESDDTGMTESEAGDMMDSDDDEGADESPGGGGPSAGTQ